MSCNDRDVGPWMPVPDFILINLMVQTCHQKNELTYAFNSVERQAVISGLESACA